MAVVLALLWSIACIVGLVSAAAAIIRPSYRVALLRLAGLSFGLAGLLAILSVGVVFLLLAAGCFWLAANVAAAPEQ